MDQHNQPQPPDSIGDFARKVLAGALIVAVLVAIWQINQVLVLGFGGIVVAVILRNMSAPIARYMRVSDHVALLITTLGLLGLAVAFFAVFGALAVGQFSALLNEIPGAIASGRHWLQSYTEGRWFLALLGNTQVPSGETLLQALPLAGGVVGGMGEALLVLLIGIYLAADPTTYVRGVVRLFPPGRRVRIGHMMDAMAAALRKWLIGMAFDMLFVGVVTGLGLWIVGVPLPFALAVLTGVSVFVPYIGPATATVPGVLLALSVSPTLALYAAIVLRRRADHRGQHHPADAAALGGLAVAGGQPAGDRRLRHHLRAVGRGAGDAAGSGAQRVRPHGLYRGRAGGPQPRLNGAVAREPSFR